jgi:hypothetical protein
MPMARPMSGFAAVLQTWPLGDSIGVRQQYPVVYATVEGLSVISFETAKCVAELVAESTSHVVVLLTSIATG